MFDPYTALARSLEREESLFTNLLELLLALDESAVGPASKIIPQWQLDRIEAAITMSEEEVGYLLVAIQNLEDE